MFEYCAPGEAIVPKRAKAKSRSKKTATKKRTIDTSGLRRALGGLGSVVKRATDQGEAMNPDDHVDDLRVAVQDLQAAVEGFKRDIKRRMLEDGMMETEKSKRVRAKLFLKPGRPQGSKDPDDYDMEVQQIH
jgi:hypothetical protein